MGAVLLIVILVRIFWRKLRGLGQGETGRRDPRPAARVRRPRGASLVRGVAGQAGGDRGLPGRLRDHRVVPHRDVSGGRQLDRQHRLGHARRGGVNQATNVAALSGVTDAATATAYSLGQQLAITAWNAAFALVLVTWAFGWTGGKILVEQSYEDAKVRVAEQKAQREARKRAAR